MGHGPGEVATNATDAGHHKSSGSDGVEVMFLILLIGVVARHSPLQKFGVPYTVTILIIGCLVGSLNDHFDLGEWHASLELWQNLDPNLILVTEHFVSSLC